jgi:hypothetical protein
MHRIALMVGVVASLLFGGVSPALAKSPPPTETVITRDNVVSGPVVNPCTGETGILTVDFTDVFHITGPFEGTLIVFVTDINTGTLTFTPDGSDTPTGTGHEETTFSFQSTPPGAAVTETDSAIFEVNFVDGSHVLVHFLFHVTITPAGDVTSFFDTATTQCA